jgi:prepilin-type N-terminal cleavage/methylation domain-containing protein
MFLPKHKHQSRSGFTLIELLIVIGILGILAAGLLAAVDPIEQLKKGRDTQRRTISVELNNALTRYYAVYGSMPWGTNAFAATPISGAAGVISTLMTAGELKPTFSAGIPAAMASQLTIAGAAANAGGDTYVCFDPESKSVSLDPSTIFSSTGAPAATTGCSPPTATTGCYFCAR